jgi:hypothetical protein
MAKNKSPSGGLSGEPSPPRSEAQDKTKDNLVPGAGVQACQRGPDGKLLPKPKGPALSSDVEPELAAMEWVWNNPADRTHQHASFRAMKTANPVGFWDRMQELRAHGVGDARRGANAEYDGEGRCPPWDRIGNCPACGREWDQITDDLGSDRVFELLGGEWEVEEKRIDRHKAAVVAFLDREGLT